MRPQPLNLIQIESFSLVQQWHLEKLQNTISQEMAEAIDELSAEEFSPSAFKTTYMLIKNKHFNTDSFAL